MSADRANGIVTDLHHIIDIKNTAPTQRITAL
jgi:hypothetical protein